MTRPESPLVPAPHWRWLAWCHETGEVHTPEVTGAPMPGYLTGKHGWTLAVLTELLVLLVVPQRGSQLDWISTVDCYVGGAVKSRYLGPGLAGAGAGVVRVWVDLTGDVVGLTDGPIEGVIRAAEELRAHLARLGWQR